MLKSVAVHLFEAGEGGCFVQSGRPNGKSCLSNNRGDGQRSVKRDRNTRGQYGERYLSSTGQNEVHNFGTSTG